jgi:alcohol dehydrogenase
LAQKACELIVKNLEAVLEDGNNLDARAGMSQASTIAGLAFSQTGTAGSHACSYRLSIEHHIPHGEACAFTLDRWVEINAEARPELRQIYQAIGFENEATFAAWINRMKAKGELRTTLRECGVTDRAEISAFADHALKNNNYANNVAQIGYEGLYKLFEEKF